VNQGKHRPNCNGGCGREEVSSIHNWPHVRNDRLDVRTAVVLKTTRVTS
jgi:hypothetical protein